MSDGYIRCEIETTSLAKDTDGPLVVTADENIGVVNAKAGHDKDGEFDCY